jgi:aspartate/methionine/tyrosine aminotransferase
MRSIIQSLEESKIREVANAGLGREGVLPFWFGESDEVTPEFIRQVAIDSLQAGDTFYSHNLGLLDLREAVAQYESALHQPIAMDRVCITAGGVNALMLACQTLLNAGDEVVAVTPVWPNLTAQPLIMGANVCCVSLAPDSQGAWQLDMNQLLVAVNATTKLLILNAPNNPTGWTLSRAEQQTILAHCRKTGTWILADEVYERLYYGNSDGSSTPNGCAPSFLDIASAQDRVITVGSMSKSFLMTGWRVGWMILPEGMSAQVGKLIEFNTSCSPVFIQKAAALALQRTHEVTPRVVAHLHQCRDRLIALLQQTPGVQVAAAPGGMYAFFQIEGYQDALLTAKRLVLEAGIGLAPGNAFAPEGQGWLRWCFASKDLSRLDEGAQRLRTWLSQKQR